MYNPSLSIVRAHDGLTPLRLIQSSPGSETPKKTLKQPHLHNRKSKQTQYNGSQWNPEFKRPRGSLLMKWVDQSKNQKDLILFYLWPCLWLVKGQFAKWLSLSINRSKINNGQEKRNQGQYFIFALPEAKYTWITNRTDIFFY